MGKIVSIHNTDNTNLAVVSDRTHPNHSGIVVLRQSEFKEYRYRTVRCRTGTQQLSRTVHGDNDPAGSWLKCPEMERQF
jgi:hypothetical protein